MVFIKLPIKFLDEGSVEYEHYQEMSNILSKELDPPLVDGFVYVNPNSITHFHESSDGHLHLSLSDGSTYTVFIPYEQFLKDFLTLEEE